jgi:hypothetical protein
LAAASPPRSRRSSTPSRVSSTEPLTRRTQLPYCHPVYAEDRSRTEMGTPIQ